MSSGSWASSPGTRRSMTANRGRDTTPELALRRAVWRRGLRYRVDARPVGGLNRRADLVFTRAKVAVFVDGCFWHSCPIHATRPAANGDFWAAKLDGTVARDRETDARLRAEGWTVLRFWEHEDPAAAADRVEATVRAAGPDMPRRIVQ
ncbi:MAG: very short patch repair endonuclease [Microthrixaceae bacterium]